jgi:peroxiredoxin
MQSGPRAGCPPSHPGAASHLGDLIPHFSLSHAPLLAAALAATVFHERLSQSRGSICPLSALADLSGIPHGQRLCGSNFIDTALHNEVKVTQEAMPMTLQRNGRLEELEGRFSKLEPRLPESPEKEAISLLHAMILQSRRGQQPAPEGQQGNGSGRTLEDVANLYKSAPAMEGKAEKQGLPVGTQAPAFALPDANGRKVSLSDLRGRNVVLVFYPLDWSPACSDQLSLYQSELDELRKLNAEVLAISVDSIYSHGAWAAVRGITFPLLADFHPKGEVAKRYNVMRESTGFSERALYVIDGNGIIRYTHISPELPKIPDIYELLEQLEQLQGQQEAKATK